MPHGVLFRGGAEGAIRECLLRGDRLEAVIGLAPNLFYSTAHPGLPAHLPGDEGRRAPRACPVRRRLEAVRQGPQPEQPASRGCRCDRRGVPDRRRPGWRRWSRGPARAARRDRGERLGPQHRSLHQGGRCRGRRCRDGAGGTRRGAGRRCARLRSGSPSDWPRLAMPDGWRRRRFGDVADVIAGDRPDAAMHRQRSYATWTMPTGSSGMRDIAETR